MKISHKTKVLLIVIAALSGLFATQANALVIGDGNYIGIVTPGVPSSPVAEAAYVNQLLSMAINETDTPCPITGTTDQTSCDRVSSTLDVTGFDDAISSGALKVDTNVNTGINVTGWTYLLGKYDQDKAGSLVWYVGNLSGNQDIESALNGQALSHYTLFNNVPEPTPLALLGVGFLGLGLMRLIKRA